MKTILKDRTEYRNKSNQLHRLDGPALEYSNGDKKWYIDGKRHRLDGPAIEFSDGTKSWFVEGKQYSETEFIHKKIEFMHKFYPVKKPEYLKNSQ